MFDYLLQAAVANPLEATPFYLSIFTALAAAVSITAISFMAGEFFSLPSLKAFAKGEASELVVSVLIILAALALATPGGDGIFDRITQGFMLPNVQTDPSHTCQEWQDAHGPYLGNGNWKNGNRAFAQADFFLGCRPRITMSPSAPFGLEVNGVILRKLTLGYGSLMITEMFIGFLSGFSTNFAVPILFPLIKLDVGMTPWIAMGPLNDVHTVLVDLVGASWAGFAGQKILLVFIEETALLVFLPFGLLLRAFPFTRKTGSTIIAVVFAAYFVYPTSILINQQIWEMIANPQPQPGVVPACLTNGQACWTDSECCSLDCRSDQSGLKTCVTPVTDFSGYRSIFSICYGQKSEAEMNAILEQQAKDHDKRVLDVYFKGSASSDYWTKTEQMMFDGWTELKRKTGIITGAGTQIWFPTPKQSSIAVFKEVEVLVMDAMQFTILAILFVVVEIVITMTLLKDFSLLIGGEPRLLGISKLV